MSDTQRASLERYFAIARDLRVRVTDVDVLVEGDEAVATFTREDDFVDAPSGRTMHLAVRVSGLLSKRPDGWRIRSLREPS
jgi:ketosteroid isomerase-like protein